MQHFKIEVVNIATNNVDFFYISGDVIDKVLLVNIDNEIKKRYNSRVGLKIMIEKGD